MISATIACRAKHLNVPSLDESSPAPGSRAVSHSSAPRALSSTFSIVGSGSGVTSPSFHATASASGFHSGNVSNTLAVWPMAWYAARRSGRATP